VTAGGVPSPGAKVRQFGEETEDRFVDAPYQPAIDRDPDRERRDALRNRLYVVQCTGVEGDAFHPATVDLVGTLEVPFEHQLAAAGNQNGVHVRARSLELT
jgi:hypothetical protein